MKGNPHLLIPLLLLALLLALLPTSAAKVITVGPPDSGADYSSIQEAVDNAKPGYTILVYPGNYTEDVTIDIDSLYINAAVTPEGVVWLKGCFQVNAYNVTIANFYVDATLKGYSVCFTRTAEKCTLLNTVLLPMGVQVDSGAKGVVIENCLVLVIIGDGVAIRGSDCRVERTVVLVSPLPTPITARGISLIEADNITVDTCGVIVLQLQPSVFKTFSIQSYPTGIFIKDSHKCLLKTCCVAINHSDTKTRSIVLQDSDNSVFKAVLLVTYNVSPSNLPNITLPSRGFNFSEFNFSWLDLLADFIVTASDVSFLPGGDLEMRSSLERAAPPEGYVSTLSYLDIAGSSWLYINFTYFPTPEVNESTYEVWMYDGSWHESRWNCSRVLDTARNVVGVNITSLTSNFKTYAVLAKKKIESITLTLHRGWNLVSIPVDKEFTPEQLFQGSSASYAIYAWNPEVKEYYEPKTLKPGEGYWVYVTSDVSITVKGGALYQYPLNLRKGWNLIGSASHLAVVVESTARCHPILWTWVPERYRYSQAQGIMPASGYWIYAASPGSVMIVSS